MVYKYLRESVKLLTHLSKQQALANKATILEAKNINKNDVLSSELSLRMNEILHERTMSSRDRFTNYVARSRNSPSKSMTSMQKQKSFHKTIDAEDEDKHVEYWSNLYKSKDKEEKKQFDAANEFFMRFNAHRKGTLSSEASIHIEKEFTEDEITSVIQSCPNRSSPGLDGTPYEVFKLAHHSFIKPLTFVLNQFYSNPSNLPNWIGTSSISLLFKKGDVHEPANYRPISLLPTLWKILSNALTQRLNTFMKEVIRPEQVGFIKTRNIEVPLHTIDSVIKEVPGAYVLAVDFEKAFDSISHKYLELVLNRFKFPEKFITLILKFLSLGQSCIKLNGDYSKSFPIERGVRQGDPLSGLLFVLALEPLLCTIYHDRGKFAPKIGKYFIPYSAFADDLTIFCKRGYLLLGIKNMLDLFEIASGLKVNHKKTEVYHCHCKDKFICNWPVVKLIKILGIVFPTQNRIHINDTIDKLHAQLAFWKKLKLPLYTKLILLTTYVKFQYCLAFLDWNRKDINKINKLIHWAIGNDTGDFEPSKRYNALFSAYRCSISNQTIGFAFEHRLWKARLARIARIICTNSTNLPIIYTAQNLNIDDVYSLRKIPRTIKHHVALWKRKQIKFDFNTMSPRSSSFKKLLNIDPPILHPTPIRVPDLSDWPIIKKLHVPSSTKSFLLKLYMNALPTADRLAHTHSQILCPSCHQDLSSLHFFSSKCYLNYSTKIFEWCEKNGLKKPRYRVCFTESNSNYELIFMSSLWKTFCHARHTDKPDSKSLQVTAKNYFKREIQIAKILYPSTYVTPTVKNIELKSLPELYSLVDLIS